MATRTGRLPQDSKGLRKEDPEVEEVTNEIDNQWMTPVVQVEEDKEQILTTDKSSEFEHFIIHQGQLKEKEDMMDEDNVQITSEPAINRMQ